MEDHHKIHDQKALFTFPWVQLAIPSSILVLIFVPSRSPNNQPTGRPTAGWLTGLWLNKLEAHVCVCAEDCFLCGINEGKYMWENLGGNGGQGKTRKGEGLEEEKPAGNWGMRWDKRIWIWKWGEKLGGKRNMRILKKGHWKRYSIRIFCLAVSCAFPAYFS